MRIFAEIFRAPCFVWACVALAGGCLAAAVAVCARKFLLALLDRFTRLPPSTKAVLAAAVVVATAFAQKPTNKTTDYHGLTRIEAGVSATLIEEPAYPPAKQPEGAAMRGALNTENNEERRHGEGWDVLDRIDKIDRIDGDRAGSSNPVNPVNPVKRTPCLRPSITSAFSAAGLSVFEDEYENAPGETVVEATGILCTSGFNRCTDGLIAMELEPYITPLDVSFFGVKVMEVPTTGSVPVGYFANPLFEPIWNHTKERQAGVWYRPRQDNYFFADAPSFGEYCPPPLSRGVIDWTIPLAWGDDDAEDVLDAVGGVGTVYHQVFTLDAEGGLRIDKFTQWIHCSADGIVTHSPGIR